MLFITSGPSSSLRICILQNRFPLCSAVTAAANFLSNLSLSSSPDTQTILTALSFGESTCKASENSLFTLNSSSLLGAPSLEPPRNAQRKASSASLLASLAAALVDCLIPSALSPFRSACKKSSPNHSHFLH